MCPSSPPSPHHTLKERVCVRVLVSMCCACLRVCACGVGVQRHVFKSVVVDKKELLVKQEKILKEI